MAKQPAVSIDGFVKEALLKIADTAGAFRLSGTGNDPPKLFEKASGPNKKVLDRLKDSANPLVDVSGRGKTSEVRLTATGFLLVAEALSEATVGRIAKSIAEGLPLDERIKFFDASIRAVPNLAAALDSLRTDTLLLQAEETARRERELPQRLAASERAFKECIDDLHEIGKVWKDELNALRKIAERVVPKNQKDLDFHREAAERLVSAWRDAVQYKKDEGREYLEIALENLGGIQRVGAEGEAVVFDREFHEGGASFSTGQHVRVTRPGWALDEGEDRVYVIEKASVSK